MLRISATAMNSTSVPLSFFFCFQFDSVGMVVSYIAMSFNIFLGVPTHSWLLWFSLRSGWKIKPTQVFLLNLTVLQLIFCVQCAVHMLNLLIFKNGALWRMSFIVFGLSWVGRPLIQICICVEQYLAVIHPVMFFKFKGLLYRIGFAAGVWLMAVGYAVYEAFADTFPDPIFNSAFIISVIIISFCCVSVLRALKQPGPGDTQIPMERGRDVGNQQKRKAFKTIFSGLLIILFTYLPQASLTLFFMMKIEVEMFYCNLLPLMNSFIAGVVITPLLKMYKNCMKDFFKK